MSGEVETLKAQLAELKAHYEPMADALAEAGAQPGNSVLLESAVNITIGRLRGMGDFPADDVPKRLLEALREWADYLEKQLDLSRTTTVSPGACETCVSLLGRARLVATREEFGGGSRLTHALQHIDRAIAMALTVPASRGASKP